MYKIALGTGMFSMVVQVNFIPKIGDKFHIKRETNIASRSGMEESLFEWEITITSLSDEKVQYKGESLLNFGFSAKKKG